MLTSGSLILTNEALVVWGASSGEVLVPRCKAGKPVVLFNETNIPELARLDQRTNGGATACYNKLKAAGTRPSSAFATAGVFPAMTVGKYEGSKELRREKRRFNQGPAVLEWVDSISWGGYMIFVELPVRDGTPPMCWMQFEETAHTMLARFGNRPKAGPFLNPTVRIISASHSHFMTNGSVVHGVQAVEEDAGQGLSMVDEKTGSYSRSIESHPHVIRTPRQDTEYPEAFIFCDHPGAADRKTGFSLLVQPSVFQKQIDQRLDILFRGQRLASARIAVDFEIAFYHADAPVVVGASYGWTDRGLGSELRGP